MASKFHVIRKSGEYVTGSVSLAGALNEMSTGLIMFMGTNEDALSICKAIGRAERERKWKERGIEPGTLLNIGMEVYHDDND